MSKKSNSINVLDDVAVILVGREKRPIIVDREDVEKLKDKTMCVDVQYDKHYTSYRVKYGPNAEDRTTIGRYLLNTIDSELFVDHINGDTFDNRKSNLRMVNHSVNMLNRRKQNNNVSGYTGVYLMPNGKYRAKITYKYKVYHLGVFKTAELAALAVAAKREEFINSEVK